MKNVQQGFTLIELMIVVAIIGILAAIAIPAYNDYIIRSRTTEVLQFIGAPKAMIGEYYTVKNALPTTLTIAGVSATTSPMVTSLGYTAATGALTVIGNTTNLGAAVTLVITPVTGANGKLVWSCAATAGTQYAPASCK